MKSLVAVISTIIISVILIFCLSWAGIEWYRYFAPKQEDAKREVFEATKSYNQGMVQQLSRYRLQYLSTEDNTTKAAIKSTIQHQYADFDVNKLQGELKTFTQEMLK